MMDRHTYALLSGWLDVTGPAVGRDGHFGGGRGGWGRGRGWGRRGWGWGGYGYPYGYGYDGGGGGDDYDPEMLAAYYAQFQQPQQMPVPVPVPQPQMQAPPMGPPQGAPAPGAAGPGVSGWYDLAGPFPGAPGAPRAAVVEAPLPTQANRDILPMSTGVPILPTQSAQITGRPQTLVFKIGRFVISNAGTAGGAADWIVNDIKIGNRSQFVQSGDVPGDLFATNAIDTFVRFEAAQTAMDVVVVVTYIGLNESGCPFFGAMVGTAAV